MSAIFTTTTTTTERKLIKKKKNSIIFKFSEQMQDSRKLKVGQRRVLEDRERRVAGEIDENVWFQGPWCDGSITVNPLLK